MTNYKTKPNAINGPDDLAIHLACYLDARFGNDVEIHDSGYGEFIAGFKNRQGEILFGDRLRVYIEREDNAS